MKLRGVSDSGLKRIAQSQDDDSLSWLQDPPGSGKPRSYATVDFSRVREAIEDIEHLKAVGTGEENAEVNAGLQMALNTLYQYFAKELYPDDVTIG